MSHRIEGAGYSYYNPTYEYNNQLQNPSSSVYPAGITSPLYSPVDPEPERLTTSPADALEQIEALALPKLSDLPDQLPNRYDAYLRNLEAYNQQRAELADDALKYAQEPQREDFENLGLNAATADAEYREALATYNNQISELERISAEAKQANEDLFSPQYEEQVAEILNTVNNAPDGRQVETLVDNISDKSDQFQARVIAAIAAESPETLATIMQGAGGDWNVQWPAISESEQQLVADAVGVAYDMGIMPDDFLTTITDVQLCGTDGINIIAGLISKSNTSSALKADFAGIMRDYAFDPSLDNTPLQSSYAAAALRAVGADTETAQQVFGTLVPFEGQWTDLYIMASEAQPIMLDNDTYLPQIQFDNFIDVSQQINDHQQDLQEADLEYDDSSVYGPEDAIMTVSYPPNRAVIEEMAERYGIDPALLAGTVAAEMDFDHEGKDVLQDGASRSGLLPDSLLEKSDILQAVPENPNPIANGGLGWLMGKGANALGVLMEKAGNGPGIASVHIDELEGAIEYLETYQLSGWQEAQQFDTGDTSTLASFNGAVEAAAISLARFCHVKTENGGSIDTSQDMAAIWGAYRTGIVGVTNDGRGFLSATDFAENRANGTEEFDQKFVIGANAYQSEPYFDYFINNWS